MSTLSPTVLITGGSRGIGLACVKEFAKHGWRVIVGDIIEFAEADRFAHEGADVHFVHLDVKDSLSVTAAFVEIENKFGYLDALVNNAGIQRPTTLKAFEWAVWEEVMAVNLHGVLRCMLAAGRLMLERGSGAIVNVVSVSAVRGVPGRAPYGAAKAAVVSLTQTAAAEWGNRGIRVNAVGPGYVDTDLVKEAISNGRIELSAIIERTPLRRMAVPSEVASVIRFLASSEASFVTGQTLFVDGGFLVDSGVPSRGAHG